MNNDIYENQLTKNSVNQAISEDPQKPIDKIVDKEVEISTGRSILLSIGSMLVGIGFILAIILAHIAFEVVVGSIIYYSIILGDIIIKFFSNLF